MAETKEVEATEKPVEVMEPHADVETWKGKNPWFMSDAALHYEAVSLHQAQLDKGLQNMRPMDDLLEEVTQEIRKRHPDKFGLKAKEAKEVDDDDDPKPKKRSAVEAPSNRGGGKKAFSFNDLDDNQRKACRAFARKGHMTEKEYIQQLADAGELR